MYVKLIGSLFLIGSAAAVGFVKAEELQVRVRLLLEIKRMIGFLQGELRFHKASLEEAFEAVAERMGSPFQEFLQEFNQDKNFGRRMRLYCVFLDQYPTLFKILLFSLSANALFSEKIAELATASLFIFLSDIFKNPGTFWPISIFIP